LLDDDDVRTRRILLVDDEGSILFCFSEYLRERGFIVECADGAKPAKEKLASTAFDLLLTDLRLDRTRATEGLDVIEYARQVQPGIQVVVLTACDVSFSTEALRRGADQFLQKPQTLANIANVLEARLQRPCP
jgi:DNA-binding NtrC family response regulator